MTPVRRIALTLLATTAPAMAQATAFQLREGSAIAIGSALAGRSANDSDVSLSIQNPATLSGVRNFAVSTGVAGIFPSSDTTVTQSPLLGTPGLSATANFNEDAIVPSFALGYRLSPEVVVGFAVKSPFGLATEFDANFISAIDGLRSELTTISATPQIAWTPTPGFTLGAGVTLSYADAELTNFAGPGFGNLGRFGLEGDGIAFGATVGVLIEPIDGTKIGLNIQSELHHELEGEIVGPALPGLGVGGDSVEASFTLPAVVSLGVIQDVTDSFRVMGELEFTGWSAFDTIEFVNNTRPSALTDIQGYENSVMVSLGAEYDLNDRWTVRGGAAFDSTPTGIEFRSQRTPDSNRYWLAAGASYQVTETIGIDAAYLFIKGEDATVQDSEAAVGGTTLEVTDGLVHLFQLNVSYSF